MAYTQHGHHIPDTLGWVIPPHSKDCGGLVSCEACKADVASVMSGLEAIANQVLPEAPEHGPEWKARVEGEPNAE